MAWTEEIFKTENYVTASPTAVEQLGPVWKAWVLVSESLE